MSTKIRSAGIPTSPRARNWDTAPCRTYRHWACSGHSAFCEPDAAPLHPRAAAAVTRSIATTRPAGGARRSPSVRPRRSLVRARPARTVRTGVVVLTGIVLAALATGCSSSPPAGLPAPTLATIPTPPTTTHAHLTKVLTIVEENHSLQQMQTSMPFLSALATQYGYATGYTAVSHPSLPNYLALSGGSTFDITNDAAPQHTRSPAPLCSDKLSPRARPPRSTPSPCPPTAP